jgi:hypothetical protein
MEYSKIGSKICQGLLSLSDEELLRIDYLVKDNSSKINIRCKAIMEIANGAGDEGFWRRAISGKPNAWSYVAEQRVKPLLEPQAEELFPDSSDDRQDAEIYYAGGVSPCIPDDVKNKEIIHTMSDLETVVWILVKKVDELTTSIEQMVKVYKACHGDS